MFILIGVLAGAATGVPIGPVNVAVIDAAYRHTLRRAMAVGLGGACADFLYASLGVGGILAATLASRAATRPRQGTTLVISALIAGSPLVALAFITTPVAAYPVLAVEGAAMIIVDVLVITTLQRILSAELLGRAFGAIDSLLVAGVAQRHVAALLAVTLAPCITPVGGALHNVVAIQLR